MTETANPGTGITAAVVIDESTLLLAGTTEAPPPNRGSLIIGTEDRPSEHSSFQSLCWRRHGASDNRMSFVAILQFRNLATLQSSSIQVVGTEGRPPYQLPNIETILISPEALIASLRQDMPDSLTVIFGFLVQTLTPCSSDGTGSRSRFLLTYLNDISQPDGFAEIFGQMNSEPENQSERLWL